MKNSSLGFVICPYYTSSYLREIVLNLESIYDSKVPFNVYIYARTQEDIDLISDIETTFEKYIVVDDKMSQSEMFNDAIRNSVDDYLIFVDEYFEYSKNILFIDNLPKIDDFMSFSFSYFNKKMKMKHVSFSDEEFTTYKALKYFFLEKKLNRNLFNYVFNRDFLISNSIFFDTELASQNDYSFLLKVTYFSDTFKTGSLNIGTLNYTSENKISFTKDEYIKTRFDILYVFKLFLMKQNDFELFKDLYNMNTMYLKIFFKYAKYVVSFMKFNYFQVLYFSFKRMIMLRSRFHVYYGGSYTKLIEHNHLMTDYDNVYNRKPRYCFIIKYSDIYNEDNNRLFFKHLLNQKEHSYEVYILHKIDEEVVIDETVSYFVRKYNYIFKFYEYDSIEDAINSVLYITPAEYVIFGTNNDIYKRNFLYYVEDLVTKNNKPSLISCNFNDYNFEKNISNPTLMFKSNLIAYILKNKFVKQNDMTLFNKVFKKELISKFMLQPVIDDNIDSVDTIKFLLKFMSISSKVCTLDKYTIMHLHYSQNEERNASYLFNLVSIYKDVEAFFMANDVEYNIKLFSMQKFQRKFRKEICDCLKIEKLSRKQFSDIVGLLTNDGNDIDMEDFRNYLNSFENSPDN